MNVEKLKTLENYFFMAYPMGFDSPEMMAIAKKHKVEKMREFVNTHFEVECFEDVDLVFENYIKLISQSSLVSIFEKAKFKDLAKTFTQEEKAKFIGGVYDFLYGDQEAGFTAQIEVLTRYKTAKWPILTVLGVYMKPNFEVLVKPTTVKGILAYFEEDLKYVSKPTFAFYNQYRTLINDIKKHTNEALQVDNAAFCGFLMMSLDQ
ncbi:hypothetical protein [Fusibacter ferrireducens]|uniref:Uncharacterized protein n=1 Tax=Fusibacter ferrireducens TaxID=2785058 RepID=A0ABR9ZQ88_9FIRM|nr:hypothetical protein [Fusibacter ferrireducens]MBF4692609.1 hypothetical protein [Fusibacter ferrireducens]